MLGVRIGNVFGSRYKAKAEFMGGIILICLGAKILLEHLGMILALVVALGVMLGKLKVAGVSLGVTGILFVGIGFSYFGMNVDEHLMHFLKEFGPGRAMVMPNSSSVTS